MRLKIENTIGWTLIIVGAAAGGYLLGSVAAAMANYW